MADAPMIVRVKPLEWQEAYDSHPWGWKARCAIMGGFYYADNDAEKQEQDALRAARILAALDLTPDPRVATLVEALAWYHDYQCEGFCKDLRFDSTYTLEMDDECAGCKARAALAAFKGDNND